MEKKLTKHGNSVALIIDKALLKLLKMDETSVVSLSISDEGLLITPVKKKRTVTKKRAKVSDDQLADELIEEYKDTFKKLAKT
ncbi:hypothetical protein BH09DEP1_BH09DEP1_8590 [soil metagenome]